MHSQPKRNIQHLQPDECVEIFFDFHRNFMILFYYTLYKNSCKYMIFVPFCPSEHRWGRELHRWIPRARRGHLRSQEENHSGLKLHKKSTNFCTIVLLCMEVHRSFLLTSSSPLAKMFPWKYHMYRVNISKCQGRRLLARFQFSGDITVRTDTVSVLYNIQLYKDPHKIVLKYSIFNHIRGHDATL